ncbi:hypothetical protein H4Q32_012656 [Labeo rohita]|uniref:LINE-1 type transposase domain-containing 1 n=1 Tax=Labeo rohita TaxID=84645 RepID=A0ABQ8M001_LABRO|nr:hypothetical protein H4Q32_012656 [Labeo rohita]
MVRKRRLSAQLEKAKSASASTCSLVSSGHDYVTSMSEEESFTLAEEEFPALPVTPCKSPAAKKMASDDTSVDVSSQLDCIKQLINCRSDAIEQKISDLNGKVDAVTSELKSVAAKVMCLERRVDQVEQPISQMQRRMDDLETYMRRRNLKLIEKEKCSEVVDVVHRLGKPQPGSGGGRPRATIIQFSTRTYRDAIWKAARNSSYLRDNGLQFREDFSKGDRERRMKLWPEVQKARAAGKTAYFVGARAFVQGEERELREPLFDRDKDG